MTTDADLDRWGFDAHTRLHVRTLMGSVPGLTITSGRRSPVRNRAVGGVKNSFHLRGRAADFVGSPPTLARAARVAKIQRVSPHCTGPEEVIQESDHLHIAW